MFKHCIRCKQAFSNANVFTQLGWRETQISGFCETCFDEIFAEKEEDEKDDSHPESSS